MKEKYDRREEILQSMQPYMEERFQESGSSIQKKLEEQGDEFWNGMRGKIERVFVQVKNLQERGQKGKRGAGLGMGGEGQELKGGV